MAEYYHMVVWILNFSIDSQIVNVKPFFLFFSKITSTRLNDRIFCRGQWQLAWVVDPVS